MQQTLAASKLLAVDFFINNCYNFTTFKTKKKFPNKHDSSRRTIRIL